MSPRSILCEAGVWKSYLPVTSVTCFMLSELLTAKRVHRQTHRPPPMMLVASSVGVFFCWVTFLLLLLLAKPIFDLHCKICFFSFVLVRAFKVWVMECKSMGKNGKQHLHMVFRVVSLASVEWDQHACIAKTKKSFHSQMCMLQVPHFSVR